MWAGQAAVPPPAGMYGAGVVPGQAFIQPQQQPQQQQQAGNQKHDIFVGNLAFNTTEDQLHQAFSEIGRVINVRMVSDPDSGKPRGYGKNQFFVMQTICRHTLCYTFLLFR
jgi:hypothetical protein